jgi:hypothetical protein
MNEEEIQNIIEQIKKDPIALEEHKEQKEDNKNG